MKKYFSIIFLSLAAASLLFTACASKSADENIGDKISTDTQEIIERKSDFEETEDYRPMPLPEQTEKWHAIGGDFEEYPTETVGKGGEQDDGSIDKWIVLMESNNGNTVPYNSWKEAGEALGLDLSILNSDSHTVLFHGNLAEEVGADGNYCLLQSVIPSPEGSTPVSTEEEHKAMIEEYSLAPEIQCASVFIGKDPSENASPEEYRENFRSLGGEYAYKEIQSVNSKKVVLKETSIKEHNSDITFYTLPLDVSADGSDPNAEVNFCADITTDNCLMEVSFGTIIKSEAENAAEKMYELLSKSIS